jgi:Nitrous oxide-stimulated promoter
MIGMYCRAHHGTLDRCDECSGLLSYAHRKIDACVFHDSKPACNECRVHCYSSAMRESVRRVMRFSGPRMLAVHPVLSVLHMLDRLRRSGVSR